MGEYLREQISSPLGIDVYFDINREEAAASAGAAAWPDVSVIGQLFAGFTGAQHRPYPGRTVQASAAGFFGGFGSRRPGLAAPVNGIKEEGFGVFDSPDYLQAQIPFQPVPSVRREDWPSSPQPWQMVGRFRVIGC